MDSPVWDIVFSWLSALPADAAEGRYELDAPGVFARVMRYPTKTRDHVRFESHRQYIDVQCTLQGAERIVWLPAQKMDRDGDYDEVSDFQFYHDRMSGTVLDNQVGHFTILFPDDAHAPMLTDGQHEAVLKVVVKVPVSSVRE